MTFPIFVQECCIFGFSDFADDSSDSLGRGFESPWSFLRLSSLASAIASGLVGLDSISLATVTSVSVFRGSITSSSSSLVNSTGTNVITGIEGSPVLFPGSEGGWEIVIIEDMDAGRPVSAQSPLSAAWKNGDAQYKTSLCVLEGLI